MYIVLCLFESRMRFFNTFLTNNALESFRM